MRRAQATDETGVAAGHKYRAFLSYRSTEARQAEWLHRQLERYRIPRSLVGSRSERGVVPARLGRIFRDRDESRSAERIETFIAKELAASEQLIVLCTPSAVAEGSWVPREIELFRQQRPDGAIHAVIGAGTPETSIPQALYTTNGARREAPLAADLRPLADGGADGERKAVVRLVAGLLGVDFDDLWRRAQRQRRIRRVITAVQLTGVAGAVMGVLAAAAFYRHHAMVDIDMHAFQGIATALRIIATEESPRRNGSVLITDRAADFGRMRLPIPSGDVIIRLVASYNDGAERAVAFHWVLKDGYRLSDKRIRFPVPSGSDIAAHPGMALIPSTRWIAGSDTSLRERDAPFWIDIRPPTVIEYSRIARQLLRAGAIDRDNSFILRAQEDSAALTKTGLDKVRALGESLGGILNAIAQSSGRDVSAPGDIVVGQTKLPCATCPAPMTRFEAKAYCRFRGMWLPVARQWELAARGVDGRTFPWGDRSDTSRANIPGLPATVGSSIGLKPVDAYRDQRSPFGLYDTVGNAGDWVENDVSSYERVYMGATYQFNPEDATTFRMLPVTDADFAVREITARCIAPAGPPIR